MPQCSNYLRPRLAPDQYREANGLPLRSQAVPNHLSQACNALHPVPPGFRADLLRWRQLVAVQWLAALLAQQAVAAAPARHWLLLEVACDGLEAYLGGHIPGAQYLDTRLLEHLPFWNALPPAQLRPVLQHAGIAPDSTVILYGRNTLAAARVAHLLLTAGVADVRLLDGGLSAWCHAGLALQHGPQPARMPLATGRGLGAAPSAPWQPRPDYLVHTPQVKALLVQPDAVLVSIRTRAEFMGETSGYSYIAPRGEIAGARWGHAGVDGDVNSMRNFQDEAGRMRPAAEIARIWREAGIGPELQNVFYCGTGWRASLAFFYAWLMGWERISVYDGGWFEWSADPANPVRGPVEGSPIGFSGNRLPADVAAPEY
ncbi:MAG: sulfurtransferase [Rhodoferax sp.]|nr:sulfurtransferase [Rhodoferax sp.]